jgi:hypothetical protein
MGGACASTAHRFISESSRSLSTSPLQQKTALACHVLTLSAARFLDRIAAEIESSEAPVQLNIFRDADSRFTVCTRA